MNVVEFQLFIKKSAERFGHNKKTCYLCIAIKENGSVAQLNRASDYGSEGYRFESCRCHEEKGVTKFVTPFSFVWAETLCGDNQRTIPTSDNPASPKPNRKNIINKKVSTEYAETIG